MVARGWVPAPRGVMAETSPSPLPPGVRASAGALHGLGCPWGRVEPHVMCSGALTALTSPTCTPQGGGLETPVPRKGSIPGVQPAYPRVGWSSEGISVIPPSSPVGPQAHVPGLGGGTLCQPVCPPRYGVGSRDPSRRATVAPPNDRLPVLAPVPPRPTGHVFRSSHMPPMFKSDRHDR